VRLAQAKQVLAIPAGLLLLLLAACNCAAGATRGAGHPAGATPISTSTNPTGSYAAVTGAIPPPARFASTAQYPASVPGKDFITAAGTGNVAQSGTAARFSPQWDSAPHSGLSAAAYCVYGLGLDAAITTATLTLSWNGTAPPASQAFLGLSDRSGQQWRWQQLWGSEIALGTAQQYADPSSNIYVAVVLLGTQQRTLDSLNLAARSSGVAVLGRPSDDGVAVSVLGSAGARCYVEYGTVSGEYSEQTAQFDCDGSIPQTVDLTGLNANKQYYYRVCQRAAGELDYLPGAESTFHTSRPAGATYVFAIQADPHLDERTSAELYERTLANIQADQPDFLIDLGDTFMLDKMGDPQLPEITQRLQFCRGFYAQACSNVPLLLVSGNHDGEQGWLQTGETDNLANRSCLARLAWYPAPVPDGYYSCAPTADPICGQRGGYFAWEWGDALLIVLDPYWYTHTKPKQSGDNWDWTLGREQYDWLKQILSASQAQHKLVFIHQVVGGNDTEGRGGAEAVPYYEWGGKNADGSSGFSAQRPGWDMPIHQLLLAHGVEAVFHGHDHFYAKQEVDGIIYQLVPQPGNADLKPPVMAKDYGYLSGKILPGSGHVRLTVAPTGVTVEFIQAVLPANETDTLHNGQVSDSYVLD